jgi:hypothetical protein
MLVYRLPEELRPVVLAEVKGLEPDVQKKHILAAYAGLLAEHVDTDAYIADQAKRRAHAAKSRAGAAKGWRTQRLNPADPAGAKWTPDYRSPLNRAVFPKYGKIPVYISRLNRFMSAVVRGAIIAIGDVVDHQGEFVLPRATLAEQIGCSERKAYAALETLRAAGLIKVKLQGSRTQATVWRYADVAEVDTITARKVLQAARSRAAERAEQIVDRTGP